MKQISTILNNIWLTHLLSKPRAPSHTHVDICSYTLVVWLFSRGDMSKGLLIPEGKVWQVKVTISQKSNLMKQWILLGLFIGVQVRDYLQKPRWLKESYLTSSPSQSARLWLRKYGTVEPDWLESLSSEALTVHTTLVREKSCESCKFQEFSGTYEVFIF